MLNLMQAVRGEHSTRATAELELRHGKAAASAAVITSRLDSTRGIILPHDQWPDGGRSMMAALDHIAAHQNASRPPGAHEADLQAQVALQIASREMLPRSMPVNGNPLASNLAAELQEQRVVRRAPAPWPCAPASATAFHANLKWGEALQNDAKAREQRQLEVEKASIERTVIGLEHQLRQERRAWEADSRDINVRIQNTRQQIYHLHSVLQEIHRCNCRLKGMVADERRVKAQAMAVAIARSHHNANRGA